MSGIQLQKYMQDTFFDYCGELQPADDSKTQNKPLFQDETKM